MGRRPPALTGALLLAAALAGCREPARPLARGTVLGLRGVPPSGDALVWVVPAAEFRVCAPVARSLRRLQRSPTASPLVVAFVGPHPEWMSAYLRSQRVRAEFVALSEAEYSARFGGPPVHALYRVRDRRMVEPLPVDPSGLEARIRAGLAAEGPPRTASHP